MSPTSASAAIFTIASWIRNGLELWPLNPDFMNVDQLPDRSLKYTYRPHPGKEEKYTAAEILHVRGLSLNSITGVSVLQYAANTIGLSIAQQTHGAALFRNGGLPTFWISRPAGKTWTPDASNFRQGWRKLHAGPENAGNPPILQDGMELHELGLSNRDSQWLESLNFNAIDICRFFGVPPHMAGIRQDVELDVEQMGLEFVLYTLGPLAVRFEQAADRDLVLDGEDYFTKYDFDALLRGNKLRGAGREHRHPGRLADRQRSCAEEGRNPVKGGDEARFPTNMQPAGGGPDWNEQGGQPGKGRKKAPAKSKDEDEDLLIDEDDAAEAKSRTGLGQRPAFAVLLDDAAARMTAARSPAWRPAPPRPPRTARNSTPGRGNSTRSTSPPAGRLSIRSQPPGFAAVVSWISASTTGSASSISSSSPPPSARHALPMETNPAAELAAILKTAFFPA